MSVKDELIWKKFTVLDDGFICLVDVMGDDSSVVQAARVSYGKGTKSVSDDKTLIRHLYRMGHSSPFEQCELKFMLRTTVEVMRQLIRHRTACLAEGTEIYFDLPGGIKKRGNQLVKRKIEDLYDSFNKNDFRKSQVQKMQLRQMDEDSKKIQHTTIKNIFKNGKKEVFEILLEDGKTIECTNDHQFFFNDGWSTLKNKMGLVNQNGLAVYNKEDYFLYINGIEVESPKLYEDKDWLNRKYNIENLTIKEISELSNTSYHNIRRMLKKFGIQHSKGGRFGNVPWNKGKTYKLGEREITEEHRNKILAARSGKNSNFWKGGVTSDRENIGRWTTEQASKVHKKFHWTCQLCREKKSNLHTHHIIPVWADLSKARDFNNLITLCIDCHKKVHGKELDYVEQLSGKPVEGVYIKKTRKAWNKLTVGKLVRIKSIKYVGIKETYDIEVNSDHHNFIANGIITHNSINEYSMRYSEAIDSQQKTRPDEWRLQSTNNKQGSSGFLTEWPEEYLFGDDANYSNAMSELDFIHDNYETPGEYLSDREKEFHQNATDLYQERLKFGIAREQARKDLPLSNMTEAYWKIDLRNLLNFLSLRMDSHAQLEIRSYANIIGNEIVAKLFPTTWEAFTDYTLEGISLSRLEINSLSKLLSGVNIENAEGVVGEIITNKRERQEFLEKLKKISQ